MTGCILEDIVQMYVEGVRFSNRILRDTARNPRSGIFSRNSGAD